MIGDFRVGPRLAAETQIVTMTVTVWSARENLQSFWAFGDLSKDRENCRTAREA
jgi:hypothetical protein